MFTVEARPWRKPCETHLTSFEIQNVNGAFSHASRSAGLGRKCKQGLCGYAASGRETDLQICGAGGKSRTRPMTGMGKNPNGRSYLNMNTKILWLAVALLLLCTGSPARADAVTNGAVPLPAVPAAGHRSRPVMRFTEPDPLDFSNHDGYVSLFDGVSLKG